MTGSQETRQLEPSEDDLWEHERRQLREIQLSCASSCQESLGKQDNPHHGQTTESQAEALHVTQPLHSQPPNRKARDAAQQAKSIAARDDAPEIDPKYLSEEYWNHVKEEAELKLRRMKQEKEILQSNSKLDQPVSMAACTDSGLETSPPPNNSRAEANEIQRQSEGQPTQPQSLGPEGKGVKTRPRPAKKATIPRPVYPKPAFDYLAVYSSFNRLFTAHHLLPNVDLVPLWKEIVPVMCNHVAHFALKAAFQSAAFTPFESSKIDPRLLLLHAEATYIDLKTLVERLQTMDDNLNGRCAPPMKFYRAMRGKEEVYDIVTTGFLRRKGWGELPHACGLRTSWNVLWSWSRAEVDLARLLVFQKLNHFPFNKNLSRKDLLYRNLDDFRRAHRLSFPFLPLTFHLPKEFSQFSAKFHEKELALGAQNLWIMKPIGKSRGRGIRVVASLAELNYTEHIVVQQYIRNPLLLHGYKFDLRIYVLVASFHPLQAYLYKEGFARLSSEKFSLEAASLGNAFVHLTNFAINRHNPHQPEQCAAGSKISLKTLKDHVTKMGLSFTHIWDQVKTIVVTSLVAASVAIPACPNAFELFGYDIMVDDTCQCHLIEVNSSPSLERAYPLDEVVKQALIDDILDLVEPPDFDRQAIADLCQDRMGSPFKKFSPEEENIALARVFKYQPIQQGAEPQPTSLFERIAPCALSDQLARLVGSRSGASQPHNID